MFSPASSFAPPAVNSKSCNKSSSSSSSKATARAPTAAGKGCSSSYSNTSSMCTTAAAATAASSAASSAAAAAATSAKQQQQQQQVQHRPQQRFPACISAAVAGMQSSPPYTRSHLPAPWPLSHLEATPLLTAASLPPNVVAAVAVIGDGAAAGRLLLLFGFQWWVVAAAMAATAAAAKGVPYLASPLPNRPSRKLTGSKHSARSNGNSKSSKQICSRRRNQLINFLLLVIGGHPVSTLVGDRWSRHLPPSPPDCSNSGGASLLWWCFCYRCCPRRCAAPCCPAAAPLAAAAAAATAATALPRASPSAFSLEVPRSRG
ncbi:hypothetical protein ACSSS7_000255 [Eimeria intestinalis]